MPIIRSAIKKMRRDEKRRLHNKGLRSMLRTLVTKAEKSLSEVNTREAVSALDKAVKRNIIHRNAASRKKSSLMNKLSQQPEEAKLEKQKAQRPIRQLADKTKTRTKK